MRKEAWIKNSGPQPYIKKKVIDEQLKHDWKQTVRKMSGKTTKALGKISLQVRWVFSLDLEVQKSWVSCSGKSSIEMEIYLE